jgi:hypothetical protein
MSELLNEQEFERYAAKWGWQYDNGGSYEGEHWTWYYSSRYHFPAYHIVLMRQPSGRVAAAVFAGLAATAIWSGVISAASEFDALMARVDRGLAARGLTPKP